MIAGTPWFLTSTDGFLMLFSSYTARMPMGLLRKIFGKPEPAESADLAGAASSPAPRVTVMPLHRITFAETRDGEKNLLANISTSGMALIRGNLAWPVGEERK